MLRFITFKLIPLLNQTHGKKKPIQKHKRLIQNVYNVKSLKQKETNLTTFAQQAIKEEQN